MQRMFSRSKASTSLHLLCISLCDFPNQQIWGVISVLSYTMDRFHTLCGAQVTYIPCDIPLVGAILPSARISNLPLH